ncbi:MAG: hypothetical protein NT138_09160 [Planctomycetales bacterium]|jgi:hypothetical protein|nr:hypothetical protein [Planctomycetales bacterium]
MSDIPADAQTSLLRYAADALKTLGIPYFVTGSQATIVYGEPRFTNDVDIVIDLRVNQIPEFLQSFEREDFYLSESAVRSAVERRGMFNLIDSTTGGKIDFVVAKNSDFERSRFTRVRTLEFSTTELVIFASPEDVILKKMQWFTKDHSDRHVRDILGVLRIQKDSIDLPYIESWLEKLGVTNVWRMIQERQKLPNPQYE